MRSQGINRYSAIVSRSTRGAQCHTAEAATERFCGGERRKKRLSIKSKFPDPEDAERRPRRLRARGPTRRQECGPREVVCDGGVWAQKTTDTQAPKTIDTRAQKTVDVQAEKMTSARAVKTSDLRALKTKGGGGRESRVAAREARALQKLRRERKGLSAQEAQDQSFAHGARGPRNSYAVSETTVKLLRRARERAEKSFSARAQRPIAQRRTRKAEGVRLKVVLRRTRKPVGAQEARRPFEAR